MPSEHEAGAASADKRKHSSSSEKDDDEKSRFTTSGLTTATNATTATDHTRVTKNSSKTKIRVPPNFSTLLPEGRIEDLVSEWIQDDVPSFDVGGMVVGDVEREAILWMKSPGILAGCIFFEAVFHLVGCEVEWEDAAIEGTFLSPATSSDTKKIHLATVRGPAHLLLRGERTALNTLSRCSGVATQARKSVDRARELRWKGWIAGTRKTTPGFRLVEKYGLLVGGAATHRLDLSQMVMLKDNHIWSAGSISKAVKKARRAAGFSQKIEVECQDLSEALEAAGAGADIVMLDNFPPAECQKYAPAIKEKFPHVLIEASGSISLDTLHEYLCDAVDIVSQGKLTQGYPCLDFSLKIVRPS